MKARKILAMVMALALTAALAVGGTLAYLTSQDTVTNTFTVGNVAITLDEQDVDNSTDGKDRDQANSYKLMPGHTYVKDPIVHVTSTSENCYLFVKVTNEISAIEGETTVADQMTAKGWAAVDSTTYPGIYVYIGTAEGASAPAVVAANTNVTVFENFTISGDVDNTTLASYENKTITVTAYAIQADGFGEKSASEIWTAAKFA